MSSSPPPFFNGFQPSPSNNTELRYNFNSKVVLAAVAIFIVVMLLIVLLHVYARWCWLHPYGSIIIRASGFASAPSAVPPGHHRGLDPAAVAQLPAFLYKARPASPADASHADGLQASGREGFTAPLLECAVCLGEFQDNQRVRLLPSCKHSFHVECIDMWFFSHSTCPLCRAPAISTSPPSNQQRPGEELQVITEAPRSATEGIRGGGNSSPVQLSSNVLFCGGIEGQLAASTGDQSSASYSAAPAVPRRAALPHITVELPPVQRSGAFVLAISSSGRWQQRSTCCTHAEQAAADGSCSSTPAVRSPSNLRASLQRMLSRQSSRHQSNNAVEGGGGMK